MTSTYLNLQWTLRDKNKQLKWKISLLDSTFVCLSLMKVKRSNDINVFVGSLWMNWALWYPVRQKCKQMKATT